MNKQEMRDTLQNVYQYTIMCEEKLQLEGDTDSAGEWLKYAASELLEVVGVLVSQSVEEKEDK